MAHLEGRMATRSTNEAVSSVGTADAAVTDELACADEEWRAAALALLAQDHRILATRWAAIAVAIEAGAEPGSVRECIVGLIEAAREHFVNEEWAMRTVGWPDYLAHKAEHARLLRDACDMLKNFDVAFTA